jgi:folate-binding protein YgfZ
MAQDYLAATILFDLSGRGKIEATGNDAANFLHNLSTNDIKTLPPGNGVELFLCNATAKVVAHAWAWRQAPVGKRETIWLDLDPGLDEKVLRHLDHFLISEDVTLINHTQNLAQLHLAGPESSRILEQAGLEPGEWKLHTFLVKDSLTIRCVHILPQRGFDILCPRNQAQAISERLCSAGVQLGDADLFERLRIEAGTPVFGQDMDENTFAPEVNRTAQAISYQKGCYLGQEPIVMARDRGVVQRMLVGLRIEGDPVSAGSLVFRESKEIGRVTSCIRSPRLGTIALGYIRRSSQTPGTAVEVAVAGEKRSAQVVTVPFEYDPGAH